MNDLELHGNRALIIGIFSVLNSRLSSAVYKVFSALQVQGEKAPIVRIVLLSDQLSFEMSDSFPLHTEEQRIRNLGVIGLATFVDVADSVLDIEQYAKKEIEQGGEVALLSPDSKVFRTRMKDVLKKFPSLSFYTAHPFAEDDEDFLKWKNSRAGK